jgi:hypothetical protein
MPEATTQRITPTTIRPKPIESRTEVKLLLPDAVRSRVDQLRCRMESYF